MSRHGKCLKNVSAISVTLTNASSATDRFGMTRAAWAANMEASGHEEGDPIRIVSATGETTDALDRDHTRGFIHSY